MKACKARGKAPALQQDAGLALVDATDLHSASEAFGPSFNSRLCVRPCLQLLFVSYLGVCDSVTM